MLQIQDPVHGHITLDGMFADIVNTPEFQRLRSIEQVSFRPAYPGARHDRFIHSLGTYHLATKFAEHFFRNLAEDTGITVDAEERRKLQTTFRYAALLHDIGHAPFSHTTEGFFQEADTPDRPGTPLIWTQLAEAIREAAPQEYDLFNTPRMPPKGHKHGTLWYGAPHEVASAIVLVSKWDQLTRKRKRQDVDLALAARMVIGYTYSPEDSNAPTDPARIQALGIRNCLIQLLNSSILDVDRLDYLGRDTLMTGFVNAPVDLETLAASVTAVELENGWLEPAFRSSALRVFDLMFQAKLSHDAWVIANPGAVYDAALLKHCIRELGRGSDYLSRVFSVDALSRNGIELNGRRYRLLSDVDISADLKARSGAPFDELNTRVLGERRIAAWRSYYEFSHIFTDRETGLTTKDVYEFFKPLLDYMDAENILVFDAASYDHISRCAGDGVIRVAMFLRSFLMGLTTDKDKKKKYSAVLVKRSHDFTLGKKVDPDKIRFIFPKRYGKQKGVITRSDGRGYSTYADLTGASLDNVSSQDYFYLYRIGGLGHKQLAKLRTQLAAALNKGAARKRT